MAARKAEKLGYKNIKVFHAGLPAWKKAGNLVVSNGAAIENYDKQEISYILMDLRPSSLVEKGHIPKAVSVPAQGIDSLSDQFPSYKGAPIILYNQDGNLATAQDAFKKIAGWGYNQVSILNGGFQGWEKVAKQVVKGPAATKITYVRKLMPGEFEVAKFKELLEKPTKDIVILDVRLPSEVADGKLADSLHVPMDELDQRLAEVPKDKPVVLHCATGARAEMAYEVLKKAGINARWVKAKIEFDKADKGKYTIEE